MTTTTEFQSPPSLTLRELISVLKNPTKQLPKLTTQYPDILRLPYMPMPAVLVQNPTFAKHILQENYKNYEKGSRYGLLKPMLGNGLLLSEGDFWRKQRLLTQPAFHRKRLEVVANIAVESTVNMMSHWKSKNTIDFTDEMGYLTIEIVSKALFSSDVGDKVDEIRQSIDKLNKTASFLARLPLKGTDWVMKVPYPKGIKKAIKSLDDTIYGIIETRRNSEQTYDDLLSMLMDAKYEDTEESMTDKQLRDELMTIFIAGHETTVISLSWTAYLLTRYPDTIEKIRAELSEVTYGQIPKFEDLPKLKYLTAVINESMRLYPPIYFIGRRAVEDDVLGKYNIPAKFNVGVNILGLHRHPDYWNNPDEFIPERFFDFDLKGDNRFLFLPFGGGPRTCIGNNFAMMEMQLIVSIMLQEFNFQLASTTPSMDPQLTLRPNPSICLNLVSKNN